LPGGRSPPRLAVGLRLVRSGPVEGEVLAGPAGPAPLEAECLYLILLGGGPCRDFAGANLRPRSVVDLQGGLSPKERWRPSRPTSASQPPYCFRVEASASAVGPQALPRDEPRERRWRLLLLDDSGSASCNGTGARYGRRSAGVSSGACPAPPFRGGRCANSRRKVARALVGRGGRFLVGRGGRFHIRFCRRCPKQRKTAGARTTVVPRLIDAPV